MRSILHATGTSRLPRLALLAVVAVIVQSWPSGGRAETASAVDSVSPAGTKVRGLFVSSLHVSQGALDTILPRMEKAGLNALVVDVKDDFGRIWLDTKVTGLSTTPGYGPIDWGWLSKTCRARGIYLIGRLVCFKDNALPERDKALAVLHSRGGLWRTEVGGFRWLDPYNHDVHERLIALAKEAVAHGVDEVQLDYIRFPNDRYSGFARYPARGAKERRARYEVLSEFLEEVDRELSVPLSVDLFGNTAYHRGGGRIGQWPEQFAPHVEFVTPMLYLTTFPPELRGKGSPSDAYNVVRRGVSNLRGRLGKTAMVRPFLQAFGRQGTSYSGELVRQQIRGAEKASADGYLLWNQVADYGTTFAVLEAERRQ